MFQMDVCERYGVRYSEFLRWDLDDRHKAVMHRMRRAQTCSRCGTHPDEWDPMAGGHVDAYVVAEHECKGCARIESYENRQSERERRPGVTPRLERFDPDDDEDDEPDGGSDG